MPREVSQVVDQVTDYIKSWTNKELAKLQTNQDTSICIPIKNGYKIGLYKLQNNTNKSCDVLNPNGELVHTFESKVSAILYTIYTIKRKYKTADQILSLDKEINKNYMDTLAMTRSLRAARKQKDYMTVDVRMARLEVAEKQLKMARDGLSTMHNIAKINKVWN
jgi:hypothetical protein